MKTKIGGNEEYIFKIVVWLMGVVVGNDALDSRVALVHNGEKRWKNIRTQLQNIVSEIANTVDDGQIARICKEAEKGRVYFRMDPMTKKELEKAEEWCAASRFDLQVIMDKAGEAECTFCTKTREEAAQCELRKAMRRYTYGDEGKDIDGCAYRGWEWQIKE